MMMETHKIAESLSEAERASVLDRGDGEAFAGSPQVRQSLIAKLLLSPATGKWTPLGNDVCKHLAWQAEILGRAEKEGAYPHRRYPGKWKRLHGKRWRIGVQNGSGVEDSLIYTPQYQTVFGFFRGLWRPDGRIGHLAFASEQAAEAWINALEPKSIETTGIMPRKTRRWAA